MRGGKRPGAGRRKNVPNKASAAREFAAQASGETPRDVMLDAMRQLWALAQKNKNNRKLNEHYVRAAAAVAKDLAPYIHPRISATGRPVAIDLPPIKVAADAVAAMDVVIAMMSAGKLSPDEAQQLAAVIEVQREAIKLLDVEVALRALEKQVFKS
jgi:hypothetical protein